MIWTYRRFIARLAIALMLFMQLAVAAYACPSAAKVYGSSQTMESSAMEMAGGCCPTLDPADPNLCLEHGQQGNQTTGVNHPPAPLGFDLPLLAVVPAVELTAVPMLPDILPEFLTRTTAPPPTIRFGVFRS